MDELPSFADVNSRLGVAASSDDEDMPDLSFLDDEFAAASQQSPLPRRAPTPPPPPPHRPSRSMAPPRPLPSSRASADVAPRGAPADSRLSIWDVPESEPGTPPPSSAPTSSQPADNRSRRELRNIRTYDPRLASDSSAWWYTTTADFDSFSDPKKRAYTHIAALLFEGVAALAGRDCTRCRRDGVDCRVYGTRQRTVLGGHAPKNCAYCIKSNRTCDAVLASADNEVAAPIPGECASCSEKDERIAELEAEVRRLRRRLGE